MSVLLRSIDKLDKKLYKHKSKSLLLLSLHKFNDFVKRNIRPTGNPYYGLKFKCRQNEYRQNECTYESVIDEIIADGNCLFASLLYILDKRFSSKPESSRNKESELRKKIVDHYIEKQSVSTNITEKDSTEKNFMTIDIIRSFTDIYEKNVIVIEIYADGNINATLILNKSIPFTDVDFLILTQNPGHFTTFREGSFPKKRVLIQNLLKWRYDNSTIGDIINEKRFSTFEGKNEPILFALNYEELEEFFRPNLQPLARLQPLNMSLGMSSTMSPSLRNALKELKNKKASPRSPSMSPSTKMQYNAMLRAEGLNEGNAPSPRSPSMSPSTKKQYNAMIKAEGLNEGNAQSPNSRSRSRSPSMSTETMLKIYGVNENDPPSPKTKSLHKATGLNLDNKMQQNLNNIINAHRQHYQYGREEEKDSEPGVSRKSAHTTRKVNPKIKPKVKTTVKTTVKPTVKPKTKKFRPYKWFSKYVLRRTSKK